MTSSTSLLLLLLLLLLFSTKAQAQAQAQAIINVWPKPTSISFPSPTYSPLSPSFQIRLPSSLPRSHPLRRAASRCRRLLFSERHRPLRPISTPSPPSPPLLSLSLSISSLSAPLSPSVNDSYILSTHPNGTADLSSATPWGAIRGLQTLSQLASGDPPLLPAGIHISDRPIFPHRGILLDTSRNFYPVRDLMRTVRAMGYNKLNVLHWHITDSHSFPVVLPSEPALGIEGSYGPSMRYSVEDVRRVVEYALSYGVRVVPEIDTPGHAASWAGAYPEIVTCADRFWSPPHGPQYASEPGAGQLNPLHPSTYDVIRNVHRDAAGLFPDLFFHAGADEVSPACWSDDPTIRSFLSPSGGGTHDELLEIFVNETRPFLASTLNRTVVYWEDVLLGPTVKVRPGLLPPESTVIQTWRGGPATTKRLTSAGYRVIVSSSDFYYLDCGHGGWVGADERYDRQEADEPGRPFNYEGGDGGSWCAPFKTWQRVYDYDITYGLSEEEAGRVIGGEVALWSEQADGTVVDGRLWPRAAALAEAMWSGSRDGEGRRRSGEAGERLMEWRWRMVGRGIRAEPIQPLWCAYHQGMCDLTQSEPGMRR